MRLAIDDFGTGYSALALLQRSPVDTVKIDRSFIAELGRHQPAAEFIRALVAMGDALGLVTVVEGVEAPAQAEVLRDLGCHLAQGYLFGRPRAAHELAASVTAARTPSQ